MNDTPEITSAQAPEYTCFGCGGITSAIAACVGPGGWGICHVCSARRGASPKFRADIEARAGVASFLLTAKQLGLSPVELMAAFRQNGGSVSRFNAITRGLR